MEDPTSRIRQNRRKKCQMWYQIEEEHTQNSKNSEQNSKNEEHEEETESYKPKNISSSEIP